MMKILNCANMVALPYEVILERRYLTLKLIFNLIQPASLSFTSNR